MTQTVQEQSKRLEGESELDYLKRMVEADIFGAEAKAFMQDRISDLEA